MKARFSGAAAVAGVVRRSREDPAIADAVVVVNLTGSDRPEVSTTPGIFWITKREDGWVTPPPNGLNAANAMTACHH
jgi:hypothetical protein